MRFTIVTPSLRQPDWLRLCARSVADQGVECEHLVQDSGTGAALDAVEKEQPQLRIVRESDTGIYDALNRGFSSASGDIFAWLNCDEQYLPGALAAVQAHFESQPETDVLLADNLIVDPDGCYLAHRFSLIQKPWECLVRFAVSSCALFFRSRVWQPFDTRWKSVGDWWWYVAMLQRGAKISLLRRFVAAFTETGKNLGLSPITQVEQAQILAARPWWMKATLPCWLIRHRIKMRASGAYNLGPFEYALHAHCIQGRRTYQAKHPTPHWQRPTVT